MRPTRLTLLSHIIANRLAQKMEGRPNKNVRLCTYTGLYMCVSTEPGMKCPGLFYDGPKKSRWVGKTVSGESRPCGMALFSKGTTTGIQQSGRKIQTPFLSIFFMPILEV